MNKIGKIILTVVVLMVIAVPLGFFIKYNFSQRLAKVTSQSMDSAFGLKSFPTFMTESTSTATSTN